MALEPWRPNRFVFDFVVIFLIVAAIGFGMTRVQPHLLSPTLMILIVIIVAISWTVIGRWSQNRTAEREHWVREIAGSTNDTDTPLTYSKETEAKWKRRQEAFLEASNKATARRIDEIAQERRSRLEEMQHLEKDLDDLKNTTIDITVPIVDGATEGTVKQPDISPSPSLKDIVL